VAGRPAARLVRVAIVGDSTSWFLGGGTFLPAQGPYSPVDWGPPWAIGNWARWTCGLIGGDYASVPGQWGDPCLDDGGAAALERWQPDVVVLSADLIDSHAASDRPYWGTPEWRELYVAQLDRLRALSPYLVLVANPPILAEEHTRLRPPAGRQDRLHDLWREYAAQHENVTVADLGAWCEAQRGCVDGWRSDGVHFAPEPRAEHVVPWLRNYVARLLGVSGPGTAPRLPASWLDSGVPPEVPEPPGEPRVAVR
jgi:hypothetical protein